LNSHEDDSDEREEERTTSVKDLTQKLASSLGSPTEENKTGPYGDMKGIISKAKEELARSQSRADMKLSGGLGSPGAPTPTPPPPEIKKSEAELQWDALKEATSRPLKLCDLDFEDLGADEEHDVLTPAGFSGGVPPPPPPMGAPNPPVIPGGGAPNPPPAMRPPPQTPTNPTTLPTNKTKKTVKLFWKEKCRCTENNCRLHHTAANRLFIFYAWIQNVGETPDHAADGGGNQQNSRSPIGKSRIAVGECRTISTHFGLDIRIAGQAQTLGVQVGLRKSRKSQFHF
ncbi:unnamed protein product, partial [Nesidiocoris tenuis]